MATQLRGDFIADVMQILGMFPIFSGENEFTEAEVGKAVDQAVEMYEKSFPQIVVEDETGDDGRFYALTDLASWEDGFSDIEAIDYNAATRVSSDESPNFLSKDNGDWGFYQDASVKYLDLKTRKPSSGTTFRVYYTARHTLTEATSTIDRIHELAITYLSVAKSAAMMMIRIEKGIDPPAGQMFVTMRNKSSGFKGIVDQYMGFYYEETGGKDGDQTSQVFREFDLKPVIGGQYIFHSGSLR